MKKLVTILQNRSRLRLWLWAAFILFILLFALVVSFNTRGIRRIEEVGSVNLTFEVTSIGIIQKTKPISNGVNIPPEISTPTSAIQSLKTCQSPTNENYLPIASIKSNLTVSPTVYLGSSKDKIDGNRNVCHCGGGGDE